MEIQIGSNDQVDQLDDEQRDLLETLVRASGDELPNIIDSIDEKSDYYILRLTDDMPADIGNAYGRCLVAHGWSIIGVHQHRTEDDRIDAVSVKRIDDIDSDTNSETMLWQGEKASDFDLTITE